MSRPIKFRGNRVDNGEWVYGIFTVDRVSGKYFIITDIFETIYANELERVVVYEVIPKSVGQFASLPDKNGKEIYEGDVAKTFTGNIAEIKYGEYQDNDVIDSDESSYMDADGEERKTVGFYAERVNGECYGLDNMTYKWIEVIGNIYEDGDLLCQ